MAPVAVIGIGGTPRRSAQKQVLAETEEFLNEFGLGSIDEVYAAGNIERLFGPVFAIMENGLNNSAQNAESSQELRSPSLNNPATKST